MCDVFDIDLPKPQYAC